MYHKNNEHKNEKTVELKENLYIKEFPKLEVKKRINIETNGMDNTHNKILSKQKNGKLSPHPKNVR